MSGPGAEVAKEVAGGARSALKAALGPALEEFGQMLGDQVKFYRFTNLLRLQDKINRICDNRGIAHETIRALPIGDSIRTLEAASLEETEEVQELWARLVVRAATAESPRIDKLYIEILSALSPADTALLALLDGAPHQRNFKSREEVEAFNSEQNAAAEATWRRFDPMVRQVSVQNLSRLRCITFTPRLLNAENLLHPVPRARGQLHSGSRALVEPKKFESVLSQLLELIFRTSGARDYEHTSPLPLHYTAGLGFGRSFGASIEVPEFNYMLTTLGQSLMQAVKVRDRRGGPNGSGAGLKG